MWPQQPIYPGYYPQQNGMNPGAPVQQLQKSAQFYSVESPQDLDGIRPSLNVMYFGVNSKGKAIYLKQINNDGRVSVDTYSLVENKKEKSELETVLDKISELENKLMNKGAQNVSNNTANVTTGNPNVPVRQIEQPSFNASIQPNDGGQNAGATA